MKSVVFAVLFQFSVALAFSQVPVAPGAINETGGLQLSIGYLRQGSKRVSDKHWFRMDGVRADLTWPLTEHIGMTAEFSGVGTNGIASSGTGLMLISYMVGPRLSMPLNKKRQGRVEVFVQGLIGGVHASEGLFPSESGLKNSASSSAIAGGGGLQVRLNRRTSLRLFQMDYLYTRLPNGSNNYQTSYRIGAGIQLRLR